LRRGLRADRRQKMLRGLLGKLLRRERLGLALAFAGLHFARNVRGDLRAEAERLVLGEGSGALLGELRIVGEVVSLPVLDRVVVRLWQRPDVVVHASSVPSFIAEWSYRSPCRTQRTHLRHARCTARLVQLGLWLASEDQDPLERVGTAERAAAAGLAYVHLSCAFHP